jgi:hypothetical protein
MDVPGAECTGARGDVLIRSDSLALSSAAHAIDSELARPRGPALPEGSPAYRHGDDEMVQIDNVPVTIRARTILDLYNGVSSRELERARSIAFSDHLLVTQVLP